ncbi:MAG: STAS domain-containing protein [Candidatus Eisenbacteria sp.]|nr:STAS domain-containing protein [Candidatus Eisenbacteria bacterium]
MKLKNRVAGDVTILDLSGNIMGGPDQQVFHTAVKEIVDGGGKKVIINLGDVPWVNSTGLGILMAGFITMKNAGGVLRLINVGKRIGSLLMITKLSLVFETFESEKEALASFGD